MSRGLNKIMLIGRVGTDPEMRFTPSGKPVTNFRLAVNRRRRPQEGEAEETDWFTVVCWERLAEIADQYVTKGTQIFVEGRLQIRRFTAKDGSQGTSVDVVAQDFQLLGSRADRGESGGAPGPARGGTSSREEFEEDIEDLPF